MSLKKEEHIVQIIDKKEKIIELLKNVLNDKIKFSILLDYNEFHTKILKITDKFLIVKSSILLSDKIDFVGFSFILEKKNIYLGQCLINNISSDQFTLDLPKSIEQRAKRKFNRIKIVETDENININVNFEVLSSIFEETFFQIKNNRFESFIEIINIMHELRNFKPDITKIILLLSSELKKIASNLDISFKFSTPVPNRIDFIKRYKKILFISDVQDKMTYLVNHSNDKISSLFPLLKDLQNNNSSDKIIKDYLLKIMSEDRSISVSSYLCCPIFLLDEFISYIFLGVPDGKKYQFSEDDISFVESSGKIINEALLKNRLYQIQKENINSSIPLNLSAGGIAMSVSGKISKYLKIGWKLKLQLFVQKELFNVIARIIRISISKNDNNNSDKEEDKYIVIAKFVNLKWSIQNKINQFVMKNYNKNVIIEQYGLSKKSQ